MFDAELQSLKEKNILRQLRVSDGQDGVHATIDGRQYTLFCSNDYLGLSQHPAVKKAAKAAIDDTGAGAGAAPLINGRTSHHERLEEKLASFKSAERALLFGSGYLANTGAIPALAGSGDIIISDELNHASIIDGCRLSRADVRIYRHADTASLEEILRASAGYRRRWVVTEGVFGMDGDIAPMPDILDIAASYDAGVFIDDAHGTGTVGANGRGTLERFGLTGGNVVHMGTLGKALGSYGAFIAAKSDIIDWLVNSARSFMFSTALPPASVAAALASLLIIEEEKALLRGVGANSDALRTSLKAMGLTVLGDGTPIIPVVVGGAGEALRLSGALMERGYFAPAIRPPTVPDGGSRIRFTVSALHTEADLAGLTNAIKAAI